MCYIYIKAFYVCDVYYMVYYNFKKEILPLVTTWMNLESIMLTERQMASPICETFKKKNHVIESKRRKVIARMEAIGRGL